MAFGMNAKDMAPASMEKMSPAAAKLKYAPKKKKFGPPESKESPQSEAANHSAPFLKKAFAFKKK